MKKLSIFITIIISFIIFVVFFENNKTQNTVPGAMTHLKVVTSFYPLTEFTEQIGGEHVEVINIVPPGAEPHDFEPTPQDIATMYSAKLLIFNGGGFDVWADKISFELKKRNIAIVNMAEYFDLMKGTFDREDEETHEEASKFNPHIWLDPVLARREVEIIRDALKKVDPDNFEAYDQGAERYIAQLSELDRQYQEGLASCINRDVVASHSAFGYLAKRYNFNVVAIFGLSTEEEPSPRKIAEIAEFARQKNIKYIFFETLVSPKFAETIAKEIGAKTSVFNPLEGLTQEELAAGKNYISIMKENLLNLRQALVCK
ncbi:zinc ABC transporter substrate-binding protein [Candidatus Peregrinibacteria bacterium]|nr:zinc ABC transporter substrate-binding protein [Candidatus Peregrinibacteria bacterium]